MKVTLSDLKEPATLHLHRGLGILAGDFVKPDPVMTRRETRVYLLAELERWLSGRILNHVHDIALSDYADNSELEPYVTKGTWPAARLYMVLFALEMDSFAFPDGCDRLQFAAQWAVTTCKEYLEKSVVPEEAAANLAVGFVRTDTLPGGETVESFWNYSPFEPARSAPPLSDGDANECAGESVEAVQRAADEGVCMDEEAAAVQHVTDEDEGEGEGEVYCVDCEDHDEDVEEGEDEEGEDEKGECEEVKSEASFLTTTIETPLWLIVMYIGSVFIAYLPLVYQASICRC
jgi:hypothetical protein